MPNKQTHKWDQVPTYRLPSDSGDGNERNERACQACGLTKITVIPPQGIPWRRWRWPGGEEFGGSTPQCPKAGVKLAEAVV